MAHLITEYNNERCQVPSNIIILKKKNNKMLPKGIVLYLEINVSPEKSLSEKSLSEKSQRPATGFCTESGRFGATQPIMECLYQAPP